MKKLSTYMKYGPDKLHSGQALLVILLTMAVILTVVLSVASRSVTDVSITTYEEDALRAFSAAEAGVEKALLTGEGTSGGAFEPVDPGDTTSANYATTVKYDVTAGQVVSYPQELNAGETATFWMVSHDDNGNLTCGGGASCLNPGGGVSLRICWGDDPKESPSNSDQPAIIASVYYDTSLNAVNSNNYSNVQVKRFAFDRYPGTHSNNFISSGVNEGSCVVNGKDHLYRSPDISSVCGSVGCILMVKVRMYYNPTPQSVAAQIQGGPSNVFPAQGKLIESTGVAGDSTRKVKVFQSFPEPPSIFDAAVFSMNDFSKNP